MSETLFKETRYDLGLLIQLVERGEIGLPDIQRPFVWKNAKVRDLFDSMYRGYPVGYLLFWQNGLEASHKVIGTDFKQKVPRLLIVDGQQRLTSLFAVVRSIPVIRENYEPETIQIAFRPTDQKFEVFDAAIAKDPEFIPNISVLWAKGADLFEIVESYLTGLSQSREVAPAEKTAIRQSITRLQHLLSFPFTALELSSGVSEEQVAEVFVRINSAGKSLNQADFILTLMSVFWDEGRTALESFCHAARQPLAGAPSPFNHFIEPGPDQLLRVSVGLGFKRARLQYVYSILRGKDLETGEFSDTRRVEQFDILKKAQSQALDLGYWHDFLKCLMRAGFRSGAMISSENNLIFSYVLFLIGRTEMGVENFALRECIARWFFMSSLAGRYTGSPETTMEFDLARLREVSSADGFLAALSRVCEDALTEDFWAITLPNLLATAAANSPALNAYHAALNLIEARVLFSKVRVADLLDPSMRAKRSAIERHHLFPKAHLKALGITGARETNQIANYALVEWGDNAAITAQSPAEYFPKYAARFAPEELEKMMRWHALPAGWQEMNYAAFLEARRKAMARVIRDGYVCLTERDTGETAAEQEFSIGKILAEGESGQVEFKSTLRMNLHTRQRDPKMEQAVLKSIAAFLNGGGGTLLIGVNDRAEPLGLDHDGFESEDKMNLHLTNLINDRIGAAQMLFIRARFMDQEGKRILTVTCRASKTPAYVKDGNVERFYVRTNCATMELPVSQIHAYITQRFGGA